MDARTKPMCGADSKRRYACTRDEGHDGPHVALGAEAPVYDVWPALEAEVAATCPECNEVRPVRDVGHGRVMCEDCDVLTEVPWGPAPAEVAALDAKAETATSQIDAAGLLLMEQTIELQRRQIDYWSRASTATLRDQFAMAALTGLCVGYEWPHAERVSKYAYEMADAMIAARESRNGG